MPAAAQKIE